MGRWKALNLERFVSRNHPEHELNFAKSSPFASKIFPGKFPFFIPKAGLQRRAMPLF
jgi:hypothetical protein